MDLSQLGAGTTRGMARGLMAIASSDGIHNDEAEFLGSFLYREGDGDIDQWMNELKNSPPIEPEELIDILSTQEQRMYFLELAHGLALSDGVISAQEQSAINKYALLLDVDLAALSYLLDAAKSAGHPYASALPQKVRENAADIYYSYLKERNGELDIKTRILSKREPWFLKVEQESIQWPDPIDLTDYENNLLHFKDAGKTVDPIILMLLVISKVTRSENYGAILLDNSGRIERAGASSPDAYQNTEELYHTRILANICRCFGVKMNLDPPEFLLKVVINGMVKMPKSTYLPIVLASEVLAVMVFKLLIGKANELLGEHPKVRDQVVLLLRQILTDEIGHVAFCRSKLGKKGIRATKLLAPLIESQLQAAIPEFGLLVGQGVLKSEIDNFNFEELLPLCIVPPFWIEAAA
jgi:hypothetical protein